MQFDTLRHIRSTYSKVYQSSPAGVYEAALFAQGTGCIRSIACPTQSDWMLNALRGMEMMMGFDSQVDHAILAEAMLEVLRQIQADAEAAETVEEEISCGRLEPSFALVQVVASEVMKVSI